MSSSIADISSGPKLVKQPVRWSLWLRQLRAIFRLEIEKNFLGRRAILIYLLALLPILPLAILAPFTPPGREWQDFTQYSMIYSIIYGGFIFWQGGFFCRAWFFFKLFFGGLVGGGFVFLFLGAPRAEGLGFGQLLSR